MKFGNVKKAEASLSEIAKSILSREFNAEELLTRNNMLPMIEKIDEK